MKLSRVFAAVVCLAAVPSMFALAHRDRPDRAPGAHAQHPHGAVKARPADDVYPTATPLYSFGSIPNDVGYGEANPIQAKDGAFYSIAGNGGASGTGGIFRFTPAGGYQLVYSFASETVLSSGLTEGSDGNLYGEMTSPDSEIYAYNIARKTIVFAVTSSGAPAGGLAPDGAGNLYGVTYDGGTNSVGSIFKLSFTDTYPQVAPTLSTLYSFTGTADGQSPESAPLLASDGFLYGSNTEGCGGASEGAVWKFDPSSSAIQGLGCLYNNTPYYMPAGGFVEASDGNLYAVAKASLEGSGNGGVYSVTLSSGALGDVYEFPAGGPDEPVSGVPYTDNGGNLLITSYSGGSQADGLLADVTTSGDEVDLHTFSDGDAAGNMPFGAATFGSDGNLYGTTAAGAANTHGSVFTIAAGATPMISLTPSVTTVDASQQFSLSWQVLNAFSKSAQACYATSSDSLFSGAIAVSATMNIAAANPGTHTYAITCGGVESATATVIVEAGQIALSSGGAPVSSYDFGGVPENTSPAGYSVTLTNNGHAAFPFSISVSGSTSGHFSNENSCGSSVPAQSNCTITFFYTAPASAQNDSAAFAIAPHGFTFSPGSNTFYVYAHAVAAGVITLSANTHNYGTVDVGSNNAYTFTVFNGTGATQAFSLSGKVITGGTNQGTTSTTCGATLAVDAQCTVTYLYSPTTPGAYEYEIQITTPATVKPASVVKLSATAS